MVSLFFLLFSGALVPSALSKRSLYFSLADKKVQTSYLPLKWSNPKTFFKVHELGTREMLSPKHETHFASPRGGSPVLLLQLEARGGAGASEELRVSPSQLPPTPKRCFQAWETWSLEHTNYQRFFFFFKLVYSCLKTDRLFSAGILG